MVSVCIPDELMEAFRKLAKERNCNPEKLINAVIFDYLKNNKIIVPYCGVCESLQREMNGGAEYNSLKWNYDAECDSLFVHRLDNHGYEETVEMSCDVLMDFDTLLNPSAFEFLNASLIFKSDKWDLCEIKKIKVHVSINEDLIKLHVVIFTPENKFETIGRAVNYLGAPCCEKDMF